MKKKSFHIVLFLLALAGCSSLREVPKVIWGSSTLALERARPEALSRTYQCSFDDCFDAILELSRKEVVDPSTNSDETSVLVDSEESDQSGTSEEAETSWISRYKVFLKDRIRGRIVVMGVPGQINTTEVGIFLDETEDQTIKIDIASLSSRAKEKVAQVVFAALDKRFDVR